MRWFKNNTHGAVTVIVTLILIPSVLISGTSVDLARIHTANSIVQDANQLAANAAMTQYDALLHDIYGLFGIVADDPELAEMINNYIEVAVFGKDWQRNKPVGVFQLFYSPDKEPMNVLHAPDEDKNLRNTDVLRRQIEEYMKFRGPVILIKEFLDLLAGNSLDEDTAIINDKLEIDSAIEDIYKEYKKLYEAINNADESYNKIEPHVNNMSYTLYLIQVQFVNLKNAYENWEYHYNSDDENSSLWLTNYYKKYEAIRVNIRSLTNGGNVGVNWVNMYEDDEGNVYGGYWGSTENKTGLTTHIKNAKDMVDYQWPYYDEIVDISKRIDGKNAELNKKIDELERKLQSDTCNEDLKKAMTEPDETGKSLIEHYREMLRADLTPMANTNKSKGHAYLGNVKTMLDDVKYRNASNLSAASLTPSQLSGVPGDSNFNLNPAISASSSHAARYAAYSNNAYPMPGGFLKYAECSNDHKEFYELLHKMMTQPHNTAINIDDSEDNSSGDAEKKQRNIIDNLLRLIDEAYNGLTNSPLGAKYIEDHELQEKEKLNFLEIVKLIGESLNNNIVEAISDPLGSLGKAGDYLLLLTYDAAMFSNYTTTKPESVGETDLTKIDYPKSITGVPISTNVNYFFQSEWEYLYNGDSDAGNNLNAITKLLFIVRLVCNYITVFSVKEVSTIVTSIRGAFSWCPPLGIVLGELARAAFVAAETVMDIAALRTGHKVPLIKSSKEWICSPSGIVNHLSNALLADENDYKNEKGLSYSNYMLFFFITKAVFQSVTAIDELAKRTADLVEWNVINYKENVEANEGKMSTALGADDRFRLLDMNTDFNITTTVKMRTLFLSMPFAQKGVNGVVPLREIVFTATDYRGY